MENVNDSKKIVQLMEEEEDSVASSVTSNVTSPIKQEEQIYEIDLLELLNVWRHHILEIILSTVGFGIIGFLITYFLITPLYSATSSIYVVSASTSSMLNLADLNFGTSLTRDYVQLVRSRTLLQRVLRSTGENLTVSQLNRMLSVGNEENTRILTFSFTSSDPEQAKRLADSFTDEVIIFLPEVMDLQANPPRVIDRAVQPDRPVNMRYLRNIAVGLIIGFLISAGVFTVIYLLNDTLDSSEDVERWFNIVPMATIPENGQKHGGKGYYYYRSNTNDTSNKTSNKNKHQQKLIKTKGSKEA